MRGGVSHSCWWRMIFVLTFVAMMGLARILENSLVMVSGSTVVT